MNVNNKTPINTRRDNQPPSLWQPALHKGHTVSVDFPVFDS